MQNKNIDIVKKIATKVSEKGGSVYYVGGYIRDKILGIDSSDIDIEVHGITVPELREILSPIGKTKEIGKSFGIFSLEHCDIDISMPRSERKTGDKHTSFEVTVDPFMGTKNAAKRRDFTINSVMQNVLTEEIVDEFNGVSDIKNGIIRHTDDNSFSEDPLRVLRAARFASKFDFDISEETLDLMKNMNLSEISPERILQELKKVLTETDNPEKFFKVLRKTNNLTEWFPELKNLIGIMQNADFHKEKDAFEHTLMVLKEAVSYRNKVSEPFDFMLSALCHDFGKAVTTKFSYEDKKYHSYRHEEESPKLAESFLKRIRASNNTIRYVKNMTLNHMSLHLFILNSSSQKAFNRTFDKSIAPMDLCYLSICDSKGKIPKGIDETNILMEKKQIFDYIMARPYVKGEDLIQNGFLPCENFKIVLEYAHKLRLAGVDKENALKQTLGYAKSFCKRKE